jgi:hypothetical protein
VQCFARLLVVLILIAPTRLYCYSVLTHETIVDSMWDKSIVRLLHQRFPKATTEEIREAHAYAYGGSIIQDMGYYPFGSHFFTDLTHYVRSGDFVRAMLRDARDVNEYAFALGSLAHFAADNNGHRLATNRAVPMLYPKLKLKYGDSVTYADDPAAHISTEFAFDVLQVAKGRYVSDAYRGFIGFQVSKPLLERAFLETYGLELDSVFTSLDLSIGSYRRSVSTVIPTMTKVAWEIKKDEIQQSVPGLTREKFLYNLSRAGYEKEWGKEYHHPGFGTKLLALLVRIVPKIGPFRALRFHTPTPETEKLFLDSVNKTIEQYRALLSAEASGRLQLANENLDLGEPVVAGKYKNADEAYATLVDKLADHEFEGTPPQLRTNILTFYKDESKPIPQKKNARKWRKLQQEIKALRQ